MSRRRNCAAFQHLEETLRAEGIMDLKIKWFSTSSIFDSESLSKEKDRI